MLLYGSSDSGFSIKYKIFYTETIHMQFISLIQISTASF